MKKLSTILLAAAAILSAACQKEAQVPQQDSKELVSKTFTVSMPETKTTIDGLQIKWSAGDQINVIAADSGSEYTFDLVEGENTTTAVFSGTIDPDDEGSTFYAVYPAITVEISGNANQRDLDHGILLYTTTPAAAQTAVKDSFDPRFGFLTAKADADGNFQFRHGAAYFKIKVGLDGVSKINLKTSKTRFYGRPSLNAETGAFVNIDSARDNVDVEGTFENGGTYYIPVPVKDTSLGDITVTYSFADGTTTDQSITTGKMSSQKLELGKVYDLGCPPIEIKPAITAEDVTIEADATAGAIQYTIANEMADGVLTAAKADVADWFVIGAAAGGVVDFTCSANDGAQRKAFVTLTYTYEGGTKTVTKDVTVTQKAKGGVESHEYVFYYNSSKTAQNLKDGETGSTYFTATGTVDLGGDFKITSWDIQGYTSTKAVKMNSSGSVTFTTSSTLNSTVRFWYIRRKSDHTDAQMSLIPEGGTAINFDSPYDAIADSGVVYLEKGTKYTIKQSETKREQALLLVIVNETE